MRAKKYKGPTVLEIMNKFVNDGDEPAVKARELVERFVKETQLAHEPLTGEAYPEDPNRYCAVCISGDGGSARFPCATMRRVRQMLGTIQ